MMPNPEFPLAVGRQIHFPLFLSTSGNMVVAVSSLILFPKIDKEVTWLSSWKSLAVEETDVSVCF